MARTVAAITGASTGIGETFARRLAQEYDLILIARRGERLEALGSQLRQTLGAQVWIEQADLASAADVTRVADRLRNEPNLVLLVNNAGFGTRGLFWQTALDEQRRMHQVHVLATLELTHAALQNLVGQGAGAVINVASVSAFVRMPGSTSYSATKSWMTTFTEGLYLELKTAGSKVIVQALCPGFTRSDFQKTMGVDVTAGSAHPSWWMTSEYVVEQSLQGLRTGKLFVIPNWRYRLITALFSKLPSAARLPLEAAIGRRRSARTRLQAKPVSNGSLPPGSIPPSSD